MRLFEPHEFAPGEVLWDNLDDLDPALPPNEQESLVGCEDVLAVKYPNGVLLDVSFLWRDKPDAFFLVAIVPQNTEGPWAPALDARCTTFDELRRIVLEFVPKARDWK